MDKCNYCSNFNPIWEDIVSKYPTINMQKINKDESPLVSKFNISSYPNVFLLKNNKRIGFNYQRSQDMFHKFFKENKLI